MKKHLLKIDHDGFFIPGGDLFLEGEMSEEDGNPPIYIIPEGYVDTLFPTNDLGHQLPFYRPRWTGVEWIEDMPQSEIDELNKPIESPPTDTEILGQQMTEREIESMLQGQQITDIDLRLFEMEVAKNV